VSEEAAQKRVTRAVDRLREFFKRRGATVSAVALSAVLTSESSQAAPAALAASIGTTGAAGAAGAGGSTASATLAKGAMVAMATQKTTTLVIGGLVLLLGIGGGAMVVRSMVTPSNTTGAHSVDLATPPANGSIKFSDGTTVECVGMSEVTFGKMSWVSDLMGKSATPQQPTNWWKPDGSPATAPQLGGDVVYLPEAQDRRGIRFIFDTTGPTAGGSDANIRIPNSQGYASSVRTFGQTRRTNLAASLPLTMDKIDIRVGLAKGEWRTDVVTSIVTTAQGTSASTTQPGSPVTYGKIADGANGGCTIEMLRDQVKIGDRERSIRVNTTDGKELWCDSSQGDGNKTTYHFPCPKEKLAHIKWLSRAYEWGTLTGVSLRPSSPAGK
jgi:hypothetical protein